MRLLTLLNDKAILTMWIAVLMFTNFQIICHSSMIHEIFLMTKFHPCILWQIPPKP